MNEFHYQATKKRDIEFTVVLTNAPAKYGTFPFCMTRYQIERLIKFLQNLLDGQPQ